MQIKVPLTASGFLADRYSKYASLNEQYQGYPIISPPISIREVPAETKSLALSLLDYDAVPVSGFVWIHWLAANFAPDVTEIPEDSSQHPQFNFVQGRNSNAGGLIHQSDPTIYQHYVGPQPPDRTHQYQLTVYALKQPLELQSGFWFNQFQQAIEPQIITTATLLLPGRA
ncbi:YbhB/YbcL family Raf kinase inhibitor-like protein [Lapidilactobacillus wuchangensis]|uniref:YbhB/YbcL family Raf kinase inhibitor-like protein n=1 Tax=Lapidilactobacillus wuchangensis TaxID=2486001 RepID=UPI000F796333|nr:YbhB/YbcL family Raf kinase inhibitor-like protein [Lapidilactobacillus wuchangensis]